MSNITPVLNAYLEPYKAHCSLHPRTRTSTNDDFLKEAYKIASHITSLSIYLHSIRAAYLSTAPAPRAPHAAAARLYNNNHNTTNHTPPHSSHHTSTTHLTNSERDAIDANAKLFLRDLSASLRQLSDAETLRRTTFQTVQRKKYKRGVLARWAAGAAGDGEGDGDGGKGGKSAEQVLEEEREETLAAVRSSVLWFLGRELEKVAGWQRGMVERRVKREVERGRSVLYLVKGGVSDGYGDGGQTQAEPGQDGDWRRGGVGGGKYGFEAAQAAEAEEEEKKKSSGRRRVEGVEEQLTPEQLQLFASENRDMLKHYEDTLDQVRTAERSMLEIAELQTTLVQHLDVQSAHIGQLVADSVSTQGNVAGGNRELKRASERGKGLARTVFWASCVLSVLLVGWDLAI